MCLYLRLPLSHVLELVWGNRDSIDTSVFMDSLEDLLVTFKALQHVLINAQKMSKEKHSINNPRQDSSLSFCVYSPIPNLVLLQSSVHSAGCHLMGLLDGYFLLQGSFRLVQPRPHPVQGSWQRPVQLKMPVQELRYRKRVEQVIPYFNVQ